MQEITITRELYRKLVDALEFYGNPESYSFQPVSKGDDSDGRPVISDDGDIARRVLQVLPKDTVYFVSGHLDLTQEEFDQYYKPLLWAAIAHSSAFVVGDAIGADLMAQTFLKGQGIEEVLVYHMFDEPRNNVGFPKKGGFPTDSARDSEMTKDSDKDIAWVRPGKEKSGTARNLKRRGINSYFAPDKVTLFAPIEKPSFQP